MKSLGEFVFSPPNELKNDRSEGENGSRKWFFEAGDSC